MKRRTFVAAAVAAGSSVPFAVHAADAKTLLVAEPAHNLGYLPLYVAQARGFFKGLDVQVITLPSSGAAHTDAVLSGKAWGFIGGPEHNAFADVKGANLKAIVNVVNKGNVYFAAAHGTKVPADMKAFWKGKKIVTSAYGGTPNSITRYLLKQYGLDWQKDVTLMEVATPAIPAAFQQGKADIVCVSEPQTSKGINDGVWDAPFLNVPKTLGPYAYSTVNVPAAAYDKDPGTTGAFVEGMLRALALMKADRAVSDAVGAKEFPDLTPAERAAALKSAYADEIWEWDGKITTQSVKTAESVVIAAGLLASEVPYAEIIDTQFFDPKGKR